MTQRVRTRIALMLYPKRFWLLVTFGAVLTATFWLGSRYPQLLHLAEASDTLATERFATIEPLLSLESGLSYFQKVVANVGNWLYANRLGMTFGILFGALLLTILRTLETYQPRSPFTSSIFGIAMGAPLGVCVNCAAPIAAGMSRGGGTLASSLSTMFSSPTLNVIVLVMTFSLFPLQLGVIKVGLGLAFLLFVLPMLVRYFADPARGSDQEQTDASIATECTLSDPTGRTSESWPVALSSVISGFIGNLWYLLKLTVPLMLFAGFLGAIIMSAIPLENLAAIEVTFAGVLIVVAVGLMLPMPIAFDVLLSQALFVAGLPLEYVSILLFTLGIHSVLSFGIVARMHSYKLATAIFAVLAGFGVVSAYVVGLGT